MRLFKGRRNPTPAPPPPPSPAPAPAPARIRLDVPFTDNARVKALGARWDPDQRSWWIARERWRDDLKPWLPRAPIDATGPTIDAIVIALPTSCWRCHASTVAIAGVLVDAALHPDADPWGFLPFTDIAPALCSLPAGWRAEHGIGAIKLRHSRSQQRRYISNGCASCDALLGDFFLQEELVELTADGMSLADLAITTIKLPAAVIPDEEVSMSLGCDPPQPGQLDRLAQRLH